MIRPVPKPVRAPKKPPQPLRRSKPLKTKQWGVSRSKRGSAHRNRPREWGRMAWLHSLKLCAVADNYIEEFVGPCSGEFQVMHLGARRGYRAPDSQTALGCRHHHEDIDQARGWFGREDREHRDQIERALYGLATMAWDALTLEARERWEEVGRARLSSLRASRRRG